MLRYLAVRIPSLILVLLASSMLIFGIIRLIPGDPASTLAGPDATPQAVDAIRHQLGLDRSIPVQYVHWLGQAASLHLGRSYLIGGNVGTLVAKGFGNTIILTSTALIIAVVLSLIVGPLWASTRNHWVNAVFTAINTAMIALPAFATGVLLIILLGVAWPILPVGGIPPDGFGGRADITAQYLIMPAICLALPVAGVLTRYLAETLRTELRAPYITTATALGVSRRRIVLRYALPNALPAAITVAGIQVGNLLGGAVLVEAIFAWPGLGQLIEEAISRRDYPVIQILLLLSVAVFVVIQLVTDLLHAYLDPRIRIGGTQ